ncbi:hypothetical protein ACIRBX_20005 [Kitasatospora sp. NPDC096147]|uniref:hypothetical protein n=1 Tax=Kitasatospora sp. NPDC096147 TaxID=3364093 RepID=UPI0037F1655B
MTVPNTPADSAPEPPIQPYPAQPDPYSAPAAPARERRPIGPELKIGAVTTAAGLVLGAVVGALWLWLAPRVMLVAGSDAIRYVDPEGEQRAGADGTFALLGLGAGALCALVAFVLTRRRGGGIAVATGLAVGGLGGSLVAWQLGTRLGPSTDVVANAKKAGQGVDFSAALELGAHGALLVWPMAAMVVLLALSAAFGKREPDPSPYWAGQGWPGPNWPLPGAGQGAPQPQWGQPQPYPQDPGAQPGAQPQPYPQPYPQGAPPSQPGGQPPADPWAAPQPSTPPTDTPPPAAGPEAGR